MKTLKLTDEQLAIITTCLSLGLDTIKSDKSFAINTNFYGQTRSLDNRTKGDKLKAEIEEIEKYIDLIV